MENGGVVAAEGPLSGEVKEVEGGLSVEEKVGGVHRTNQSEGDDVFEEATDGGFIGDDDDDEEEEDGRGSVNLDSGVAKEMKVSGVDGEDDIIGDFLGVVVGVPDDENEGVEMEEATLSQKKTVDEALVSNKGGTLTHEDGVDTHDVELLEDAETDAVARDEKGGVKEVGVGVDEGSIPVDTEAALEEAVDTNEAPVEELETVENGDYVDDRVIGGPEDALKDVGVESLQLLEKAQEWDNGDSEIKENDGVAVPQASQVDEPLLDQLPEVQGIKDADVGDANLVGDLPMKKDDALDVVSSDDLSDAIDDGEKDDDEKVLGCQDESLLNDCSVGPTCEKLEDASVVASLEDHNDHAGRLENLFKDSVMTNGASHDSARSQEQNSTHQHASASEDDDIRDYHVIEEQVRNRETVVEKRQNIQSIKEVEVSSPASSDPSSAKSASPILPPVRPAGLGRGAPLLEPAPRTAQQSRANGSLSPVQAQVVEEAADGEAEEADETREKLQMIRVKFLRLAHRLGQTPHNVVVAQVLYRLGLAEQLRGRNNGRAGAFTFDRASAVAEQLEASGQEPLDFSCTLMVLGKAGVGKSATINSIFDEVKFGTNAFQEGTKKVQAVVGTVQGIKVKVIDTPGLLSSWSDQHKNIKILRSVKRFIAKTPPDIVLYLDRLDTQSRDLGDMPLLRTITEVFGPSIWFNAIVVLTHAASAPPEGPNGTTSTYDMFVTQRSHAVQQAIRQAAGDIRLMNPVSLVENHSACRTNRAGQRVLPNGQVWKPHLLLLSFASKILAEANELLKLQDGPPGRPFAARSRPLHLPALLSSLLQSRPQIKLSDDDVAYDDLDESADSDDDVAYDELPPFRPLTRAELTKLSKAEKNAYYDELEYREKLFMKKQLKEEKMRRKMKQFAESASNAPAEENGGAASVPVAMPDLALPASFDSDNPTHRYRFLDTNSLWLVRPVLDSPPGWDHDVGYEGVNVERLFAMKKIPLSFNGQISKDKKDINLQVEVASSIKHGEGKSTTLGMEMQSAGKDMAYTLRSETRFHNHVRNKASAGFSLTVLSDLLAAGLKIEDKLNVSKRLKLVMSGGALASRDSVACGGSLEATLRDKDHPLGRSLTSLGISVMDWQGELATGFNLQSQIPVGRTTNLIGRMNLNNKGNGQVSIRLSSSEQLQLVFAGLIPLIAKLLVPPEQD